MTSSIVSGQRTLAAEVLDNLPVTKRLHGGFVLGQTALQELFRFGHPALAEHGVNPGFDALVQIGGGAGEAEALGTA